MFISRRNFLKKAAASGAILGFPVIVPAYFYIC